MKWLSMLFRFLFVQVILALLGIDSDLDDIGEEEGTDIFIYNDVDE